MERDQKEPIIKNPVLKALIASYHKLIAMPEKEIEIAKSRLQVGTNSRIRRSVDRAMNRQ